LFWKHLENCTFLRCSSFFYRTTINVFEEGELDKTSTIAIFTIVQNEGERRIERKIEY